MENLYNAIKDRLKESGPIVIDEEREGTHEFLYEFEFDGLYYQIEVDQEYDFRNEWDENIGYHIEEFYGETILQSITNENDKDILSELSEEQKQELIKIVRP